MTSSLYPHGSSMVDVNSINTNKNIIDPKIIEFLKNIALEKKRKKPQRR
jgi:hypothetical protein